jgi:hypothetical protein
MTDTDPDEATATTKSTPGTGSSTDARLLAARLFNETWRLLELEARSRDNDDRMTGTSPRPCGRSWTKVFSGAASAARAS